MAISYRFVAHATRIPTSLRGGFIKPEITVMGIFTYSLTASRDQSDEGAGKVIIYGISAEKKPLSVFAELEDKRKSTTKRQTKPHIPKCQVEIKILNLKRSHPSLPLNAKQAAFQFYLFLISE